MKYLYPDNSEIIEYNTLSQGVIIKIAQELPKYEEINLGEWMKENLGTEITYKKEEIIERVTTIFAKEKREIFEEIKRKLSSCIVTCDVIFPLPKGDWIWTKEHPSIGTKIKSEKGEVRFIYSYEGSRPVDHHDYELPTYSAGFVANQEYTYVFDEGSGLNFKLEGFHLRGFMFVLIKEERGIHYDVYLIFSDRFYNALINYPYYHEGMPLFKPFEDVYPIALSEAKRKGLIKYNN